jgi:hypothetical protein
MTFPFLSAGIFASKGLDPSCGQGRRHHENTLPIIAEPASPDTPAQLSPVPDAQQLVRSSQAGVRVRASDGENQ